MLRPESLEVSVEVLLDDRQVRAGVKFADAELLGIPYRVVLGDRGLDAGTCEFRHRRDAESTDIPIADLVALLGERIAGDLGT